MTSILNTPEADSIANHVTSWQQLLPIAIQAGETLPITITAQYYVGPPHLSYGSASYWGCLPSLHESSFIIPIQISPHMLTEQKLSCLPHAFLQNHTPWSGENGNRFPNAQRMITKNSTKKSEDKLNKSASSRSYLCMQKEKHIQTHTHTHIPYTSSGSGWKMSENLLLGFRREGIISIHIVNTSSHQHHPFLNRTAPGSEGSCSINPAFPFSRSL